MKKFYFLSLALLLLVSASAQNCFDLSDLTAPNITCTYGFYENPYQHRGVIDYGQADMNSRHTVNTVRSRDPIVPIYTIPEGEDYSVRLGNCHSGGHAESISIEYQVDTLESDLLIMRYAVILQDPSHEPEYQPRFTLAILDTDNNLIDSVCAFADFIADQSLGWQAVYDVLYKDWTTIGLDMTPYHGRTIRVRLTTYDCGYGGHYGYAYFILKCGHKKMTGELCGDVGTNTFHAPDGFNYRWFYRDDPETTLSVNQSVTVSTGGSRLLCCLVSFVDCADCNFELNASMLSRYPLADYEIVPQECINVFRFRNYSTISNDGVTPSPEGGTCEAAWWDFGDGTTSTEMNPYHSFPPGDYEVTLVAGLSENACTDTIRQWVSIPIQGYIETYVCDSLVWNNKVFRESGQYLENVPTALGCDSLISMDLTVYRSNGSSFDDQGCNVYSWNEMDYEESGVYYQTFDNVFGCDSLVEMYLSMNYTPNHTIVGDHWPIGGSETHISVYNYSIRLEDDRCQFDTVIWSVDCPNWYIEPHGKGETCTLYIYSYLLEPVDLHATVVNRCDSVTNDFSIKTSYFGVEENMECVSVSPNPTSGEVMIGFGSLTGETIIRLYNVNGSLVDEFSLNLDGMTKTFPYSIHDIDSGLCYLVINNSGILKTFKILINK